MIPTATPNPRSTGRHALATPLLALLLCACQGGPPSGSPSPAAPGTAEGPRSVDVERIDEAESARAGGDYARALELFREILAENPTVTEAYIGIGSIHAAQGDFEQAEPAFARAARLEPRNFDAQYGHGRVLQALNKLLEAVRAFHRALSIRPDDPDANLAMAETYLDLSEPGAALPFAERAALLAPTSAPARVAFGTALVETGRTSEAIEQLETAMELVEPTPALLLSLVQAYGDQRRFEEAMNTAQLLVRVAPSSNAYERLGWTAFRLGRYEESMRAYRDAVRIDENNWPALNGIGVNALNAWLLSERRDPAASAEARDAFRRSLRINGDQPKVVRLLTTYQL